jgi:large subunit ribosomal protein L35
MPKIKTRKAVSKRFKLTAKKKVTKRASGQNHFNARATSDQTRSKRKNRGVTGKIAKNILTDMCQG